MWVPCFFLAFCVRDPSHYSWFTQSVSGEEYVLVTKCFSLLACHPGPDIFLGTERRGRTVDSCFVFGGLVFKCGSRGEMSTRRPSVPSEVLFFLSLSIQMPGQCLILGHDCFLLHPFQVFFYTFCFCFQPMCRVRSEAPNWGPRLW
jgi:hypothetical protein